MVELLWAERGHPSVVEEAQVCECHRHAVSVASADHLLVGNGTARLRDELNAELHGVVDGVPEGEERVGRDSHTAELPQKFSLLVGLQGRRRGGEVLLPLLALGAFHVALDVPDAGVHTILALHPLPELEAHDLRVEAQAPRGNLAARQLYAVNTALLPGADADHHPITRVADGVRLRVLDGDGSEDQVEFGPFGQVLLLGDDLLEPRGIEYHVVPLLHEAKAPRHAIFQLWRREGRIRFEDDKLPAFFRFQNFLRLWREAWCDDTVAHLDLEDVRCGHVHFVRNSDEVAEGAHRVGIPRAHVSGGDGCQLLALDLVDHLLVVAERQADCGAGGTDVLEGRRRRMARRLGQLVHELPGVHGVEEVDVPRSARDDLKGQGRTSNGTKASRQLLRITAVLQGSLDIERDRVRRWRLRDLPGEPTTHC
mmetsp:Transcript_46154/g.128416  ORF Transcript_46154/g.128416 Transcript_46154/m.128416 type:complete len:425 (+) Transcript_46154:163-1437(+)